MPSTEDEIKALINEKKDIVDVKNNPLSDEDKARVIEMIQSTGSIKAAAVMCNIPVPRVVNALKDLSFKASVAGALELFKSRIELHIVSKAIGGIQQIKYDADGNMIERIVKDSERLLLRLAERYIDEWKDSKPALTVNIENNVSSDASGTTVMKLAQILDIDTEYAKEVNDELWPVKAIPTVDGMTVLNTNRSLNVKERAEVFSMQLKETIENPVDVVMRADGPVLESGYTSLENEK
jgi:hypothetical protein